MNNEELNKMIENKIADHVRKAGNYFHVYITEVGHKRFYDSVVDLVKKFTDKTNKCLGCNNNPINNPNASGICHCTLGIQEIR